MVFIIIYLIAGFLLCYMIVNGVANFTKNVRRIADALEVMAYGQVLKEEEVDDEEERDPDDLVLVPNTPTV